MQLPYAFFTSFAISFSSLFSDVLFIAIGVRQRSKHPKQGSCPRAVSRAIHFRQQLNLRFS